ncbi:hemerythrin domain-containing protein [Ottowia caeni]|uniref:hemerythrin domain-containing protein n=1 Tax=Ottowia caeni TaxID=2870339 RepID=UPI001E3D1387|nr:hemerythrin domain-containing protein [Ottowia caeni]
MSPSLSDTTLTAPRYDIYAGIHKALRSMMNDTLFSVGRVDTNDANDMHETCERVLELTEILTRHLKHENEFIHPAMEQGHLGSSLRIAEEHVQHQTAISGLREAVSRLATADSALAKRRAAHALYHDLSLFVAENFDHMHEEEAKHNAALWASYSDAELMAMEGKIVASIPLAVNLTIMRWMIPALSPGERADLLTGMRASAPAPAFAAVLDAVRPHLSALDWSKLMLALEPERMAA